MSSRSKFLVVTSSSLLVLMLLLGAVKGRSAEPGDAYKHLMVFTEVLSKIKTDYVEEPDVKNVTLGALNGMLEAVDPFASYLSAEQYKQYQKNRDSLKGETGLVLSRKYGYVGVVDVVPGSPAAKAGLNTNDMLETIGGIGTRDMPLAYAEMELRGEPGTKVEISALRVAHPEPQKITLVRAVLKYPAVTSKMMEDQIGYIQVETLEGGNRVKDVSTAVRDLQKQGAKKLILDLRNDAVGSPDEGIALANLFIDHGTLATLQGQKVPKQEFAADPSKDIWKGPLTVITNRGTADGAEVAAGALLDNHRGELVGEKTYGFAGVRKAVTLDDGSAVILSVAKYMNASGKALQDVGVTPNVAVVETEATPDSDDPDLPPTAAPKKPASTEDLLLKRALEVAKHGSSAGSASGNGTDSKSDSTKDPNMRPLNIPDGPPKK